MPKVRVLFSTLDLSIGYGYRNCLLTPDAPCRLLTEAGIFSPGRKIWKLLVTVCFHLVTLVLCIV